MYGSISRKLIFFSIASDVYRRWTCDVLLRQVEIDPNVKLEWVIKFCYLGDTLGAGRGVIETSRVRVRAVWVKFSQLPF